MGKLIIFNPVTLPSSDLIKDLKVHVADRDVRLTGLLPGTEPSDAITLSQLNAALTALTALSTKQNEYISQLLYDVRYLQNVPVATPGATIAVINETPSGLIDGANMVYTLANNFLAGSVQVFFMDQGVGAFYMLTYTLHYTETLPNQITLTFAPRVSSKIIVNYIVA